MRTDKLGNTYTLMGEKIYKRFEIQEDLEPINDLIYNIYDNETMIVVSYITEDELDTALDVLGYLNSLDSEIKSLEKELTNLQNYNGVSKSELIEDNKKLRQQINHVNSVHNIELKHYKEVLGTCISNYPESQGLLDLKNTLDW